MGGESYTVTLDVDVADRLPNDWPPEKIEREIRGSIDRKYTALTVGDVTIEPQHRPVADGGDGGGVGSGGEAGVATTREFTRVEVEIDRETATVRLGQGSPVEWTEYASGLRMVEIGDIVLIPSKSNDGIMHFEAEGVDVHAHDATHVSIRGDC